jgi:hypothetical protein
MQRLLASASAHNCGVVAKACSNEVNWQSLEREAAPGPAHFRREARNALPLLDWLSC